ncbi:hypothetical protein O1L60_43995 [Streptomyces diastatochromogenes]|nr:hypothetical protein [Streptomyces diastatochromogenes]
MKSLRKTLTVLAVTTLISLGFAGTSHADVTFCTFPYDNSFYCQNE